jgi:hypothetical protein
MTKPPCINCITLAACRSYILNNPNHHPISSIGLCKILITEKKCVDAADYIYYVDRESDILVQTNKARLKAMHRYLKHLK